MAENHYVPGNRLVAGSTRSGKSMAEVHDILAAATSDEPMAIVVCDPHPRSLTATVFQQLIALGQGRRIVYDQIPYFDSCPGYEMISRSKAKDPVRRAAQNDQAVREFIDVLLRRREQRTIAVNPQTEEWTYNAGLLIVEQDQPTSAAEMQYAFCPETRQFRQLLEHCQNQQVVDSFRDIASGRIKRHEYLPAWRLVSGVCRSPAFMIRCGTTLNISQFLKGGGILLIEGGTLGVSEDAVRTIMGSIIFQVINYVRRRTKPTPRVLLVLDEATNAGLIGATGHEVRALAELQKAGLDVHVLVQGPAFDSTYITDGVLTNTLVHCWHYLANDSFARLAAADLGDPDYRQAIRCLKPGQRFVNDRGTVYREYVPLVNNPWAFPGLGETKARAALERIRQRPEFRKPTWNDENPPEDEIGSNETPPSPTSPSGTSASRGTSSDSSPARRLLIDVSDD